ncbi:hypothetical protein [Myxosarcina sp. GI1]|uniref:hypothetical protein n=1 Tax=Myxosarcina sp. GI1 TaxID=1541065 RepID=UPI0005609852|nr:hypothetical protein [Myxosarcina sp. GI1]
MNLYDTDSKLQQFYELLESLSDTSTIPPAVADAFDNFFPPRKRYSIDALASLIHFYSQQIQFREAEISRHSQQLKRERNIHDWLQFRLSDRLRKQSLLELKTQHFSLSVSPTDLKTEIDSLKTRRDNQYVHLKIDLNELKDAIAHAEHFHSSETTPQLHLSLQ